MCNAFFIKLSDTAEDSLIVSFFVSSYRALLIVIESLHEQFVQC